MQVTINGSTFSFESPITIEEFLVSKNIPANVTVVEINGKIVQDYKTLLKEQDQVEVIRMVGGG